jgi:transposase-like protein
LSNYTDKTTATPTLGDFASALEEVLHKGAQKMLQVAIEIEVQQYIEKHQEELDEHGHRIVVRNGYLPERELLTGIGPVKVKQPRIDDRKLRKKNEGTEGFSSSILPKYLRKIPSIDNLIPALYLKGISTNDFPQALSAILGKEADGLSATTVVRLKRQWEEQYREWAKRDLSDKEYVYFWVDGIYFNIRLDAYCDRMDPSFRPSGSTIRMNGLHVTHLSDPLLEATRPVFSIGQQGATYPNDRYAAPV